MAGWHGRSVAEPVWLAAILAAHHTLDYSHGRSFKKGGMLGKRAVTAEVFLARGNPGSRDIAPRGCQKFWIVSAPIPE